MRSYTLVSLVLTAMLMSAAPGGGSDTAGEAPRLEVSNLVVFHTVDSYMVVSTPGPAYSPMPTPGYSYSTGQDLHSTWTDSFGNEHTVTTHVTGTSNKLYVRRHLLLFIEMQRVFPK